MIGKTVANDCRYTVRLFKRRPGVTFLIIAALTLGIGIGGAVFAIVNAVLLRPVPVNHPERVVRVYAKVNRTGATMGISYPEYLDWKQQSHSFDDISIMRALTLYSTAWERPEHLKAMAVSSGVFRVFGISPILGRDFSEVDDRAGAGPVVILSYPLWQRRFGGDRQVIGRTLNLDQTAYTIIGVLQPVQINVLQYPDVWMANGPLLDQRAMSRDIRSYFPAARLKPGTDLSQARTDLEAIASRLADQYPASNKGMGIRFVGLTDLLTAGDRKPLSFLLTASGLIFVLMCVNVVIVLVGWTADRRKEMSIRAALGAPRSAIFRQLVLQAIFLVTTGSIIAIGAAALVLRFFLHRFPTALIRFQETNLDYRVMVFMVLATLVASVVATIFPAWYVSRLNINDELKNERNILHLPGRRAMRNCLFIALEVALASSLFLVSGLLIKSFHRAATADLGFNPHDKFSFSISLPARYKAADQALLFKRLEEKISSIPGIHRSSAISSLPLTTQANAISLETEEAPAAGQLLVENESVLPGFFETLKLPILKGRDFTDQDGLSSPEVVIVDEVLAEKLWPGQNPLGKRLRLVEIAGTQPPWREVVAVVREIKHFGPESTVRWMQVYVPEYQDPSPVMSFVIDSSLTQAVLQSEAATVVQELDPALPIDDPQEMDGLLNTYLAGRQVSLLAVACFTAIAVLLASTGIYGVIASAVTRKRKDLAIRLALGAPQKTLVWSAIATGMTGACIGLAVGIAVAASLARFLESFLFGVKAFDWTVYFISAGAIILIAFLSSLASSQRVFDVTASEILRQ